MAKTDESRSDRNKLRHKRCRKKIAGSASRPRLCVNFSNKHVYAQMIDDVAGKTICMSTTLAKDLKDSVQGKSKTEIAEILGKDIAAKAKEAGVSAIVFDRSGYQYGKRLKSLCEAARKGGMEF